MDKKILKYGNHIINDDVNGYMYNYNVSESYNFNSHIHRCYEFVHIIDGNLIYTVEGNDYILESGDLIMTNPDELHSFSFPKKCVYEREFLHIYPGFTAKFPELLEMLNSREQGKRNLIPGKLVEKYGIDKIFAEIKKACNAPNSDTDILVLTYAVQMLVWIKRIEEVEEIEYRKPIVSKKSMVMRDFMDHNFSKSITLSDIAGTVFMSTAHAGRLFKKETGITVKSYLNLRRITYAKNLITSGEKATMIFDKCGFRDYSTFYRAFIKYVGMPPEDFKNRAGNGED